MKIDRTTKALLALIALALFLNVFVPLLQPTVVNAQSRALEFDVERIQGSVQEMEGSIFRLVSVAEQIYNVQLLYTQVRSPSRLCSDFIGPRF